MSELAKKVVIIDYGVGNLFSIQNACLAVGITPVVSADAKTIHDAAGVILPGVGAFGDAIKKLENLNLISVIREVAASGKILMGVCLGMQLMMEESLEFGSHKGLGLFSGTAKKFEPDLAQGIKVPQVQWNTIQKAPGPHHPDFLHGIEPGTFMYFVHSYYVVSDDPHQVLAYSDYAGQRFCCAIQRDNVIGLQFHPERSGPQGIQIYKNFKSCLMAS